MLTSLRQLASKRSSLYLVSARRSVKTSTVDWKPLKSTNTPNESSNKKGFTSKIFLGLMIAMPVVSFYLGTWQMRRLKWKTNLIAVCEDRLTYPPVPLPKHFTPDMAENWEYRKVTLTGEFKHDEELFVGPRVRNGIKGYLLFTPFVRKDTGEKLLIERGWVSEDNVVPTKRHLMHLSVPQGNNITIEYLVRVAKKKGTFQWEKEDKDSRLWQIIDIDEMCAATGCTPIHIQALYDLKDHHWPTESTIQESSKPTDSWAFWRKKDKKKGQIKLLDDDNDVEFNEYQLVKAGVPIGKTPKIDLKNNHLQYLVTWYGLSFLSSIFLVIALKRNRSGAVSQSQLKRDKLRHAKKFM